MSNRTRRILAFSFCVIAGTVAMLESTRAIAAGAQLKSVGLLLVAGFFLLSAVGLAKPWIRAPRS